MDLQSVEEPDGKALRDSVDILVLPGDIASTGSTDEFRAARTFLRCLLSDKEEERAWREKHKLLPLHPLGLVVCPGNHDVFFADSQNEERKLARYVTFARQIYREYPALKKPIIGAPWLNEGVTPDEVPAHDIWSVFDFSGPLELQVLAINSAEGIKRKRVDGQWIPVEGGESGYVSAAQLGSIEEHLKRDGVDLQRFPTLCVVHHNLVHARPGEVLKRNGQEHLYVDVVRNYFTVVERMQEWRVDYLLHGHQHEPFSSLHRLVESSRLRRSRLDLRKAKTASPSLEHGVLVLLGAGAFGAVQTELRPFDHNRYHLFSLEAGDPTTRRVATAQTRRLHIEDEEFWWDAEEDEIEVRYSAAVAETTQRGWQGLDPHRRFFTSAATTKGALDRIVTAVLEAVNPRPLLVRAYFAARPDVSPNRVGSQASSLSAALDQRFLRLLTRKGPSTQYQYGRALITVREHEVRKDVAGRLVAKITGFDAAKPTYSLALWFPDIAVGRKRLALAVFLQSKRQATFLRQSGLARALRPLLQTTAVVQQLLREQELFSPSIARELVARPRQLRIQASADDQTLHVAAEVSGGGLRELSEQCWIPAIDSVFKPLDAYQLRDYLRMENVLFAAKRQVERLLITSLVVKEVESHVDLDTAGVAELVRRELEPSIRVLKWLGEEVGRCLNPLLVSFWVPSPGGNPKDRSRRRRTRNGVVGLRWIPTRDQLVWIMKPCERPGIESWNDHLHKLKTLVNREMRAFEEVFFEGIAAYVYVTGKAYRAESAYDQALVTGAYGALARHETTSPVPWLQRQSDIRKWKEAKADINAYERQFWSSESKGIEDQSLIDIPVLGPAGVEAVLQLQSSEASLLDNLDRLGIQEFLRGIRLPKG